jgi:hypothetical protein
VGVGEGVTCGVPVAVGVGTAAMGGGLALGWALPSEPPMATTIPIIAPVLTATTARIRASVRLKGVVADASGGGGTG